MYKLFGSVNEVDYHKKPRQSDLALEKLWVTLFGCLRLFMTVSMEMTIPIFWKLFWYGVKRCHYEKLIGIREFSEWLAIYCFNNTFSTCTETPENNIPPHWWGWWRRYSFYLPFTSYLQLYFSLRSSQHYFWHNSQQWFINIYRISEYSRKRRI